MISQRLRELSSDLLYSVIDKANNNLVTTELYERLAKHCISIGEELEKLRDAFTITDAARLLREHKYLKPIVFQYAFTISELLSEIIPRKVLAHTSVLKDTKILEHTLFEWWTPGMAWWPFSFSCHGHPSYRIYVGLCIKELSVIALDMFWQRFPGNHQAVRDLLQSDYFAYRLYPLHNETQKLFRRMLYTARGKRMHRWLVEHEILQVNHFHVRRIPQSCKRWTRAYRRNDILQ